MPNHFRSPIPCPKCGHSIAPAEIRRIDFERIECPKCGQRFIPGSGNVRQ